MTERLTTDPPPPPSTSTSSSDLPACHLPRLPLSRASQPIADLLRSLIAQFLRFRSPTAGFPLISIARSSLHSPDLVDHLHWFQRCRPSFPSIRRSQNLSTPVAPLFIVPCHHGEPLSASTSLVAPQRSARHRLKSPRSLPDHRSPLSRPHRRSVSPSTAPPLPPAASPPPPTSPASARRLQAPPCPDPCQRSPGGHTDLKTPLHGYQSRVPVLLRTDLKAILFLHGF